jgi:hypothetical protein
MNRMNTKELEEEMKEIQEDMQKELDNIRGELETLKTRQEANVSLGRIMGDPVAEVDF